MKKQVFFISGAYGVGKTTLCNKLAEKVKMPAFSASDLISAKVGEQHGAKKHVIDMDNNQRALIQAIEELPSEMNPILLSGHFCIFGHHQEIEVLPKYIFTSIGIQKIILLFQNYHFAYLESSTQ